MKRAKTKRPGKMQTVEETEKKLHESHAGLLDAATVSGAVAGAALGAVAGPPGIVAGGLVGTALGMLAGVGLDNAERVHDERDKELDDDIGVTKGDLGAAPPDAPPPRSGAYSGASAGFGTSHGTPSEGPMSGTDED
jgi:phage tail tape-measure protein